MQIRGGKESAKLTQCLPALFATITIITRVKGEDVNQGSRDLCYALREVKHCSLMNESETMILQWCQIIRHAHPRIETLLLYFDAGSKAGKDLACLLLVLWWNTMTKRNLWRKGFAWLTHPDYSPEEAMRNIAYRLAPPDMLSLLSSTPQEHLPRDSTTHSGLHPNISITNKENAPTGLPIW